MAVQRSSNDLSPQLCAVLGSLNISLEAELNRYRRNRFTEGSTDKDLFSDLDDAAFDLEGISAAVISPAAALLASPPPVPRNKKILANESAVSASAISEHSSALAKVDSPASELASSEWADTTIGERAMGERTGGETALSADSSSVLAGPLPSPSALPIEDASGNAGRTVASAMTPASVPGGYLESSEKLIESLDGIPAMPEPVDTQLRPNRKTASLFAGAVLGFCALVAGLGASYLMSDSTVFQRLVNSFKREDGAIATAKEDSFDPLGPDLSSREFIDLDIDNLSSLKMPQAAIDPLRNPASNPVEPISPGSPDALPPIAGQSATSALPGQTAAGQLALGTQSGIQAGGQVETQAVAIPTGSNYYITVPFTTEQGLIEVRQTVNEAFVRQFVEGGNRIQLAAFDNAQSVQQFIEELKVQGVSAQVYGPTAE